MSWRLEVTCCHSNSSERPPAKKRNMEHEADGDTSCNWRALNNLQRIGKETGRVGNKRTSGDNSNYRIIKIDYNTEESSGNLRRLGVTHTPMKDHELTRVGKTRMQ